MTLHKILATLGELTKRSLQGVMKLCGVLLSLVVHAVLADTPEREECPHDKEMREYYERLSRADYDEGFMG